MFEQSILIDRPDHKGWSIFLSLTLQLLLITVAVLLPLFFTEQLSPLRWAHTILSVPLPPAPAPPKYAQPNASRRQLSVTPAASTVFQAPRTIPKIISTSPDPPAPPSAAVGVLFGTGSVDATLQVLGDLVRPQAAPRPAPVVKEHEPAPKPIRVSGGVQEARILRRVIPAYPALAKQARIQGTVQLVGVIGKDGHIQNLQLVSGPPLLVQAALDAVKQWVYRPTLLNGEPVEVISPIDVIFSLHQ